MTPARRFSCYNAFRVALLLLLAIPVGRVAARDAATLRVLLVIDTNAGKVGGDFNRHRTCALNSLARMQGLIDSAHDSKLKGRIFLNILQGKDVTPQNIRKFYRENIGYDSRGHLLFFYSGHGGTDPKLGHYFAMSGGYILRREVYNLMADTGSPGIFILSDCCSNYGGFFGYWNPDREPTQGNASHAVRRAPGMNALADLTAVRQEDAGQRALLANRFATLSPIISSDPMRRTNVTLFYELFFRSRGVYSITAATEGQVGWAEYFSMSLSECLGGSSSAFRSGGKSGRVRWDKFYFKVRNRTNALFHERQYPADEFARKQGSQIPQAFSLGTWPKNYRRQLVVRNATKRRIRVKVKYEELNFRNDTWGWREPVNAHYTLDPGAVTTLTHDKQLVGGHKVRLWAETEDGKRKWHKYRDKDLMLTPKEGIEGPVGRFTFTFK